jgi:glycosidase
MLWLTNTNPSTSDFYELFDDENIEKETPYLEIINELIRFFSAQQLFGPQNQNLIEMLQSPSKNEPYSLSGQLEYIRTHWAGLLGDYLYRILGNLDFITEEEKIRFAEPGPIEIPVYDLELLAEDEPERFSKDSDWMPSLVLIAKNTHVWLDQLSKKFKQNIYRLDQVPDEELDILENSGFTGLWLIGLWERSKSSARIKRLCGNPEAIASAYSIHSYEIASDLGGDEAYQDLFNRAIRRGIRLSSDMVPNHMGVDASWVMEHPDWFISLDHSPFPAYSFNGPDLTPDSPIDIYIEDHYYDRSDAAVVFKRVDRHTGESRYIYHGNDGTSMPWNDTAQLNFLLPEVREAVISTILHVARKFPIIRFDAAMTLAKKHFQRLWFPEPGSGGDIPSRSDYGLHKNQFDQMMPAEFWREVVDRIASEVPDTLLLAEAFWLMEGYFVRTLGMHRVYNSAFMNMLRNEENAKYRMVIKNTLEFDPEILKRFVNFMNNPDERTAVDQFGKGDKYFGICTLMATLPGLPMFGHGQIEGFTEKYGMEYKKAYWEENPDQYLIERHEREIFPLLHKRYLFADVQNFLLYDFHSSLDQINEDVYAYSNNYHDQRTLVVYHNKFSDTAGWIRNSVKFSIKNKKDEREIIQRTLAVGLKISNNESAFLIFRDQAKNLEYIRSCQEIFEKGLFLDLKAYNYHVFYDFREVFDDEWRSYSRLCDYLAGHGVPSIEEALKELLLQPVRNPFRGFANPDYFEYLLSSVITEKNLELPPNLLKEAAQKMSGFLDGIEHISDQSHNRATILSEIITGLQSILNLPNLDKHAPSPLAHTYQKALQEISAGLEKDAKERMLILFGWVFLHNIGKMAGARDFENLTQSWMDEWRLGKILAEAFENLDEIDADKAWHMVNTIRMLVGAQNWLNEVEKESLFKAFEGHLTKNDVRWFLGINRHKGVLWFNQESFDYYIWWIYLISVIKLRADTQLSKTEVMEKTLYAYEDLLLLREAESKSGYRVAKLLSAISR